MSGRSRSRLLMVLERERPSIQTHGDEILRVGGWHKEEVGSMYLEEKLLKSRKYFSCFRSSPSKIQVHHTFIASRALLASSWRAPSSG